ncbi:hypothetical protein EQG49_00770 [Periweissella cryptocerci]|uniref:Uncharacterized protein n=1 Tax=Periweissella cryptocerci TaxID=2506420 RepID=A0A4P6YR57_9LACO|nr:hypothetical protein [Periweissella cryptocerci]QBO35086.1 hypothetical protein EQG49_00770 [Periweissella cryptocerci]
MDYLESLSKSEFKAIFQADAEHYRAEVEAQLATFTRRQTRNSVLYAILGVVVLFFAVLVIDDTWLRFASVAYAVFILIISLFLEISAQYSMRKYRYHFSDWVAQMWAAIAKNLDTPQPTNFEDANYFYRNLNRSKKVRMVRIEKASSLKFTSHDNHLNYAFGWADFHSKGKRFKRQVPIIFYVGADILN